MIKKIRFKEIFFIFSFILISVYILFIKSELYESTSTIVIKNLSNKTANFGSFSFLMPTTSTSQDAYIIQSYLESYDELNNLDKKFDLYNYYKSDKIDFVERLKPWSTREDFLKTYLKNLIFNYDQTTGLITLGFLHTEPKKAYEIVVQLINDANNQLNKYNKIIAQKQLKFLEKQVEKNKKALDEAIKKLEEFQNTHTILDPTQTAEAKFTLLSNLEAQLIEKKAKYNELSQYMNERSFELIRLKKEIVNLKRTISKIKKALANPKNKSLNVYIFEFERLKGLVELNKELYKQSLLQLEQVKTEINKNSKLLLEVTHPYIPQGYKYPQKVKDIITLALVLLLLYGIISLIQAIIKEHID